MFNDLILTPRAEREEALELLHELSKRGPIIGTDEAGRGALAGPVVAAAVCLTSEQEEKLLALKLRDSKRVSPAGREKLFEAIKDLGVLWRAYSGSVDRIDRDNILRASLWTMEQCVKKLALKLEAEPACIIVDGTERIRGLKIPQWTLIRADNLIPAVSAASIVAKVVRDRLMTKLDAIYPGYNFAKNKGYPTKSHMEAVKLMGMSKIHRYTFCKKILMGQRGEKIAAN